MYIAPLNHYSNLTIYWCSKALCCQRGLLSHAISVLELHSKLNTSSIKQMLRLIQSLGTHSITAAELKLILRLMRDTNDEEVF